MYKCCTLLLFLDSTKFLLLQIKLKLESMNEKLLALLVAKFAQARKDGLQQLARSLAIQVADEAEAQALVDKLTSDKVTDFIKEWRKEVDSEVSNSTKTFESNLKSKYDMVEKKTPGTPKADDPNDIAGLVQRSVEAALKPLQEKISKFESGKTTDTRKQTLELKLKDAPAAFKKTVLNGFGKMQFETDEEFNEFIAETESGLAELKQESVDNGLNGFPRPGVPAGGDISKAKVTEDIKEWAGTDKKEQK